MTIQAIMIDLDGTLVHTLGDFAAAINRMLGDLDLPAASTEVVRDKKLAPPVAPNKLPDVPLPKAAPMSAPLPC